MDKHQGLHGSKHSRETVLILEAIDGLSHQLHHIMSQQSDLIAAATKLSTASDNLSVRTDALVAAADRVVDALKNAQLPPEGEKALTAMQTAAANAAAEGDKVDAEVTKLDTILPTPAPAAPTAP